MAIDKEGECQHRDNKKNRANAGDRTRVFVPGQDQGHIDCLNYDADVEETELGGRQRRRCSRRLGQAAR
jgi:hypothetical protein